MSDNISVRDVRLALQGIVREWQDLAEALGLPYSEIEVIEENNPYDMKQCVREVVHQWFKGKGSESPSWTSLCTALKDPLVNRKDIASKIEEQYLQHAVKDPPSPTSSKVTSSLLRMADLFEVTELLKIMTKNEMIQLGTALGLSYIRLQKMSIYPEEMVAAWLRQDYQVLKTSGPPSWTSLVTALKRINQSGIAEIIRKEKLQPVEDLPLSPSSTESTSLDETTRKKLFEEAMQLGYVNTRIIKVLILGAAGVGKSSFLSLLLGIALDQIRRSTGVIEKAQRVMANCLRFATTEGNQWEVVGPEMLMDLLAEAITTGTKTFSASKPRKHRYTSNPHKNPFLPVHESHDLADVADYAESKTTVIKLIGRSKGGRLLKMTWIYLVDSGGQPQFHELLTAFIRSTTLGIFVFKLSDRLDDKPMVEYYENGERIGESYSFPMSHKEIFMHCVQTIYSLPYNAPAQEGQEPHATLPSAAASQEGQEPPCPKILVVGTHRDKEGDCTESRDEKNKILESILIPKQESESDLEDDIFYYGNNCIFPLNARSPEFEDWEVVHSIQNAVQGSTPIYISIPLQYYALEIEIEKKVKEDKQQVLKFSECLDIARRSFHFIDDRSARAAILHLDDLNLIQYFPSVAEGVIFCDPNVLLNKVNELIKKSYRLRGGLELDADQGGKWIKFHKRGQVTLDILEKFDEGYIPRLYDHHTVAKIFESLLILTELEQGLYFMPALLDMKNIEIIERERPTKTCLIVSFQGYAPLGLFSSSVAFLTSSKNKCPQWKFLFKDGPLFRNVISFDVNSVKVTLIDHSAYFEVHVQLEDKSLMPKACKTIRQAMEQAIDCSAKKRHIHNVKGKYDYHFFCPCDSFSTYHFAKVESNYGEYRLWCEVNTGKCRVLQPHHLQWLEMLPTSTGNNETSHQVPSHNYQPQNGNFFQQQVQQVPGPQQQLPPQPSGNVDMQQTQLHQGVIQHQGLSQQVQGQSVPAQMPPKGMHSALGYVYQHQSQPQQQVFGMQPYQQSHIMIPQSYMNPQPSVPGNIIGQQQSQPQYTCQQVPQVSYMNMPAQMPPQQTLSHAQSGEPGVQGYHCTSLSQSAPTLEEICEEVKVSPETLDQVCTYKGQDILVDYIGKWQNVARKLFSPDIAENRIHDIEEDNKISVDQRSAFMQKWRQEFGQNATYMTFFKALLELKSALNVENALIVLKEKKLLGGSQHIEQGVYPMAKRQRIEASVTENIH